MGQVQPMMAPSLVTPVICATPAQLHSRTGWATPVLTTASSGSHALPLATGVGAGREGGSTKGHAWHRRL